MAQLRDDLKYPVKELLVPSSTQDQDIKIWFICSGCQSDKRLHLCHGSSTSSQESTLQVSGSGLFRLGRLLTIKEVNQLFIGFSIQCQPSVNQQNSGYNCSILSRKLFVFAVTQVAVEALAIKNFIQDFSSGIHYLEVSSVTQMDSSARQ